ncbi:uncharacterized protein [Paramormyrops kingsleyae]|uniref:uncharacterized protein n=1 Tax=Paramormyrops kingsleyae TaxID=1676925 RepID=UPI000CD5D2A1|nr:uncharacterized protein LOC111842579 [Paramormyrops kingsleyae]
METTTSCGMPRPYSVSAIRSTVSTCIHKSLSEEQRRLVARIMCHSTETADRFYVAEPEFHELQRGRALVNDALGIGKGGGQRVKGQLQPQASSTPLTYRRRMVFSSSDEEMTSMSSQTKPTPGQSYSGECSFHMPHQILADDLTSDEEDQTICPVVNKEVEVNEKQGDKDDQEEEDEEDDNPECPSPLPKQVEHITGQRLIYRRKLVYPQELKQMVRTKYKEYWSTTITTDIMNKVLLNCPDLLSFCKSMEMTVYNLRSLIRLLQREDGV